MPKRNTILNLPGFTVQNIEGYDPIIFNATYRRKAACPYCKSKDLALSQMQGHFNPS